MTRLRPQDVDFRTGARMVLVCGMGLVLLTGCRAVPETAPDTPPGSRPSAPVAAAAEAPAREGAGAAVVDTEALLAFLEAREKGFQARKAFARYRIVLANQGSRKVVPLLGESAWKKCQLEFEAALAEADAAFTKAERLDGRNAVAFREHGALLYDFRQPDRAAELWERACQVDPGDFSTAFFLAQLYEKNDDPESAVAAYERALLARDDLMKRRSIPVIRLNIAQLYEQIGRPADALGQIERLLSDYGSGALRSSAAHAVVNREAGNLCSHLVSLCRKTSQIARGIAFLKTLKDHAPIPEIDLALAGLYLDDKSYDTAMSLARAYVGQKPLEKRGHSLIVDIYRKSGRIDEGLDYCQEVLKERPTSVVIPALMARLYADKSMMPEAIAVYRKLIDKQPNALQFYMEAADLCREHELRREELQFMGEALSRKLSLPAVIARFQEAASDPAPYVGAADAIMADDSDDVDYGLLYLLGDIYQRAERTGDAEKALRRSLKMKGDFLPTILALTDIALNGERYEEALTLLGTAREGGLRHPAIFNSTALCLSRLGRGEEQIRLLKEAIGLFPGERTLLYNLALAYETAGDRMRGAKVLEQMLADNPGDPETANALGYLYAEEGVKLDEAERLVRIALEDKPDSGAYVDSLGWIFYKRGDFEQARKQLERASQLEQGDPEILDHLGDVYLRLGLPDKARKAWQDALAGKRKAPAITERVREKLDDLEAISPADDRPETPQKGADTDKTNDPEGDR